MPRASVPRSIAPTIPQSPTREIATPPALATRRATSLVRAFHIANRNASIASIARERALGAVVISEKYASIIEEKLGDDVDVTYIFGGQPIYSFIISGE